MKTIYIINPAAGKGDAVKRIPITDTNENELVYITKYRGDAEKYIYNCCLDDPETKFVVYGGDGTINEAVNGIMKSGAGRTARIAVVPVGSGNDLIRNFSNEETEKTVDVIKYNDGYSVNIINIGFDCNAVVEMQKFKKIPFISGSFAYILGVLKVLMNPIGKHINVNFTDINDNYFSYNGEFLLMVVANGTYYGGGFNASPLSSLDDGIIDTIIINKISRKKFLSLVGDYKKGLHINHATNSPANKFKDIINYYHVKSLEINNPGVICVDGEIINLKEKSLKIEIIKNAITFTGGKPQ